MKLGCENKVAGGVDKAALDPGAMVRGIQLRDEFHAPPPPDFQTGSRWESLAVSNQRVIVSFCRV
jgi:hypothetical protein